MAAVIPAVTKISPRVIRVLGCNPSPMTLQGTNTYIVGSGKRRILIDTGEADTPQYINHLRSTLQNENIDLAHVFLTHWHHDHVGGLSDILAELSDFTSHCEVWKYPHQIDPDIHKELNVLKDGDEFSVEGATLRLLHTPGHTTDHVIFHLIEDNAIFSGDCILGEGTAVFEDLHDYIKSLQLILDQKPSVIYPGHGNIINDPVDKIHYYINHRLQREQQILDVLNQSKEELFSEGQLVGKIYSGLSDRLVKAAEVNVLHHLEKLLKDGKVRKVNEKWQCL